MKIPHFYIAQICSIKELSLEALLNFFRFVLMEKQECELLSVTIINFFAVSDCQELDAKKNYSLKTQCFAWNMSFSDKGKLCDITI